ncbi:MAG: hypothetical protein ACM3KE_12730 [Hyphomicrobiales bacterium]
MEKIKRFAAPASQAKRAVNTLLVKRASLAWRAGRMLVDFALWKKY